MILETILLFTEIPTEKMLQRQIYVQNILVQYDVLLRKGGEGLRSCAISMMGSEHQSWERECSGVHEGARLCRFR